MPAMIGLGAAAIGVGGGIATAAGSRRSAKRAYIRNSNEARFLRNFQERMSSTAHQRETIDLRKSGLNPILSAMGGKGAATPGGAAGKAQAALVPDFASTALSAARVAAEIKNINSLTELNQSKKDVIDPVSVMGETLGSGLSTAKGMITEMFTRTEQRKREARGKRSVRAYKLKKPFKIKSTPLYTRDTYR